MQIRIIKPVFINPNNFGTQDVSDKSANFKVKSAMIHTFYEQSKQKDQNHG